MREIEQKFSDPDFPFLRSKLNDWNAVGPVQSREVDHYFNAPDRDFARTDEAFRLRRVGSRNFLTYKGPKQPGAVKIRTELEIPLLDGDEAAAQMTDLLVHLGYRRVTEVEKRRESYSLQREGADLTICLDEVEGLGRFAEVELLVEDEQIARASDLITRVAEELHLSKVERRSYLSLLLESRAAKGVISSPSIAEDITTLQLTLSEVHRQSKTIGFVPTMGALHAGHLALIHRARERNDYVVVSIFVNPTQFGPHEDLTRYPRPFEDDVRLCAENGVDLIFHPTPETIYPADYRTFVEVTGLQDVLEGASRPGHFRGVATVVLKLFNLIRPHRAYFGQKDAQQVRIIQQMVKDLHVGVDIIVCPTIRESDGLALSSRNRYLDPVRRSAAVVLSQALADAAQLYQSGERDPERLQQAMIQRIHSVDGAQLDYAVAVDAETLLRPIEPENRPLLLALAVRFGMTRLIDNCRVPTEVHHD